jgi:hypothetical protein
MRSTHHPVKADSSLGMAFGHMYAASLVVVAVAASGTWYELASGQASGLLNGMVFGGNHYLKIVKPGYYALKHILSAHTTVAGDEIASAFMKNGAAIPAGHQHSTVSAPGSAEVIAGAHIAYLATDDEISLGVSNHTAGRDITVAHATLCIAQI